jgi:trehalose-6-phosphatase
MAPLPSATRRGQPVVGDGREDEKVFKWANILGDEGTIKEVEGGKTPMRWNSHVESLHEVTSRYRGRRCSRRWGRVR